MSSSVKSTLRSSSRPSRLRNFLGEPLFSSRERTKSRTSFCFSGGSSRSFSRTFSSMVMDRLLGVLASLYACRRTDGRVARGGAISRTALQEKRRCRPKGRHYKGGERNRPLRQEPELGILIHHVPSAHALG